jgi:beta-lactamase regulating signal transducer with metallopeptidase domain
MITYILKSSISLLLLFGLYWFLLRKEKLFVFNRFFLLASLVFSMVIPVIYIPVNFQVSPRLVEIIPVYKEVIPEISSTDNIIPPNVNINQAFVENETAAINIFTILLILYFSGVILFLIRFLRNIYIIYRRTKFSEKIGFNEYRIVLTNEKTVPCCFFSSIFLNREDYLNGRIDKEMLNHELEHARQSHTIDIILIELLRIFYWFNPVHILYNRAIRLNHEYLADNAVISDNFDIKIYTDKLLGFITGRSNMSLTSGLNHSFTRMRLMMMMKSRSGNIIYGTRIAMTLCMVTIFFLLLSFRESGEQPSASNLSANGTEMNQTIVRGTVMTEDGKPLAGAKISTTRTDNNSYITSTSFDGHFTIDDLSAGTPIIITYQGFIGQTRKADFTSEIIVKLVRDPDYKGIIMVPEIQNVNFRNSDFTPAEALVVIDGVIIDYKANLKLNPVEIQSFKVLKGKEATDKYGDKGKEGVVEIMLYGNKGGSPGKSQSFSNTVPSDTFRYIKYLSINHITNKGEVINIPVSNLQYVSVWTYHDIDNIDKKELRSIGIMTRDYFKVKGKVVRENGKPLPGVRISASENPASVTSDKEGRFILTDVREDSLLEFSLPGFNTTYISTLFEVAFNEELTIELKKGSR